MLWQLCDQILSSLQQHHPWKMWPIISDLPGQLDQWGEGSGGNERESEREGTVQNRSFPFQYSFPPLSLSFSLQASSPHPAKRKNVFSVPPARPADRKLQLCVCVCVFVGGTLFFSFSPEYPPTATFHALNACTNMYGILSLTLAKELSPSVDSFVALVLEFKDQQKNPDPVSLHCVGFGYRDT